MVGTNLWIGGRFTVYGGYATNYLAKLDDTDLGVDTTFSPVAANGFDGPVDALATSGSSLYVGGAFTTYVATPQTTNRLAKLDLTSGALDTTFSPPGETANGFDDTVTALAVSDTSVYAGGSFSSYRGVTASAETLAKLDLATGALDATFSPKGATANGTDGSVAALVVAGSSLYLGGAFTAYRGVSGSSTHLAKVDLVSGALDTTFSPPGATANGVNGAISAMTTDGTSLYIGGSFTAYRGVASSSQDFAKLDLTTGALDTTFSPPGATSNGFDGTVETLAYMSGNVFIGGAFTAYRGVATSAEAIAKVNATSGALDTTFSPPGASSNGFDGTVTALGVSSTTLLCGGPFTAYRGVAASTEAFAVLDPATGAVR